MKGSGFRGKWPSRDGAGARVAPLLAGGGFTKASGRTAAMHCESRMGLLVTEVDPSVIGRTPGSGGMRAQVAGTHASLSGSAWCHGHAVTLRGAHPHTPAPLHQLEEDGACPPPGDVAGRLPGLWSPTSLHRSTRGGPGSSPPWAARWHSRARTEGRLPCDLPWWWPLGTTA